MDSDAEVRNAYNTVQLSTKEMLKNNRRQHYCNMIDLLTSSCKACGLLGTQFTDEELVKFWLGDILPLMFDSDASIQNCAVASLAEALVALDLSVIHEAQCWPQIRDEFVNNYTTRIGEMREAKNNNWHKIWSLLVQIMDNDLLRGCSYINKFLAVVELGFRNPDNNVRAEAFLCWRVLIKVFAAYEELATLKRLRLLLIPLRTSQSRSSHVSSIKLRVWWYLLSCLNDELPNVFEHAVEYFLSFLFGGGARGTSTGLAHSYQSARDLSLPCLVALWQMEPDAVMLQRIQREQRLETLSAPSPLMQETLLQKHWRPMLAAAMAALQLLSQQSGSETEQQLQHLLLRNLTRAMLQFRVPEFTVACCTELATNGDQLRLVFNTIAETSLPAKRWQSLEELEALLLLCLKARAELPPAIMQRAVSIIYAAAQLSAHNAQEFRLLSNFAALLMQSSDDEQLDGFQLRLLIWRQVAIALLSYLKENALEYRLTANAQLLDAYILWPLQTLSSFAMRGSSSAFDLAFCEQWRQLLQAGHNANERKKLLGALQAALLELLAKEEPHYAYIFDAYVQAVLKQGICKDAPLYKDVFALLQAILARPSAAQTLLEACLNSLKQLLLELRQNELMIVFDALKPIISLTLQTWSKRKFEGSFLNEWKRAIQDKFRKLSSKSMANQLKELFNNDDLFVIIPSVWSLNPDKLTERQKERMAERSNIPALYNDMSLSQSQDNSIKPWTPKKVVIAKGKQSEVAISAPQQPEPAEPVLIEDSPPEEEPVSTTPKRLRRQTVDAITSDKYNFRKPRADKEKEEEELTSRQTRKARLVNEKLSPTENASAAAAAERRSPRKQQPTPQASTPTAASKSKPIANTNTKVTPVQSDQLFSELPASTPPPPPAQPSAKKPESVPETQLSAAADTELLAAAVPPMDVESSPRKAVVRICNLSSPPDRKQTNNSSSPTLRPKPASHLTGRGAQLINMIRNKKLEANSAFPLPNAPRAVGTPARVSERAELVSTPTCELNELEHTSTPIQQSKDLLVFCKRLPSPSASPSVSILKRKQRCESVDDFESPAQKRKRVSFHDPPVSLTKEYLRDVEEPRSAKPKRCLLLDKIAQSNETRQALKRRGRLDSIIEIEKFASEQTAADKTLDKSHEQLAEDEQSFADLKWQETSANQQDSHASGQAELNADAALDLVVSQCSLDSVLERYFAQTPAAAVKCASGVAKFLSNKMSGNDKLKTSVLETLSENHSKEFLDHAVRENLSSVVCDRLNPNSVLDYICAKSKINTSCRSNLLAQLPTILRQDQERLTLVEQLLMQCSLSPEQRLDLIAQLTQLPPPETRSSSSLSSNDNVAETAADSSSNL
ncbi:CG30085 [Drosophila busckii]|uniref:CG30085 n=1 Tax=Drosophila busckii TaxID=30019 RepID=A0A0M4EVR4_DROBS|nr:telomere-associated protein RIF1 [Drosophila busckii]ALC42012.1 CG30085 [Drosophila busckii]